MSSIHNVDVPVALDVSDDHLVQYTSPVHGEVADAALPDPEQRTILIHVGHRVFVTKWLMITRESCVFSAILSDEWSRTNATLYRASSGRHHVDIVCSEGLAGRCCCHAAHITLRDIDPDSFGQFLACLELVCNPVMGSGVGFMGAPALVDAVLIRTVLPLSNYFQTDRLTHTIIDAVSARVATGVCMGNQLISLIAAVESSLPQEQSPDWNNDVILGIRFSIIARSIVAKHTATELKEGVQVYLSDLYPSTLSKLVVALANQTF